MHAAQDGAGSVKRRIANSAGTRSRTSSGDVGDAREYLERIARILVHSGHSPGKLVREFGSVCRQLREPAEPWDSARLTYVADLPHVITSWHSDAQYLDTRGAPIPLPIRGRGPNLESLIRRVLPSANVDDVIRSLIALKGIRRRGKLYTPTDQYLRFNQQRLSALAHGLTALLGMLRTVEHNIANSRERTLFERAAINPSFPVVELAAFHGRLKPLAQDLLWKIDNDMRRREKKHTGGGRTRLGVGIFAFEDPQPTNGRRRGKTTPARRARARHT